MRFYAIFFLGFLVALPSFCNEKLIMIKKNISLALLLCILQIFIRCSKENGANPIKQIENRKENVKTEQANINGQWIIKEVTGGSITIYPGGENQLGFPLNLNSVYQNGMFEFINGIGFLKIPNVPKEQIGGYKVRGNIIIFDNNSNEKQQMTFSMKENTMQLSLSPEEYKTLISKSSNGQVKMDIKTAVVFHLKKQ